MIIVNYNKLFKKLEPKVLYWARKIDSNDYDDPAQEIRIYLFNNLDRYNPLKSSFLYYINILVLTAYRKIIYDKKRQEVFERNFCQLNDNTSLEYYWDYSDEIMSKIISKLKTEIMITVFYAVLYNKGEKNYLQIAKFLNMDYAAFLNHIKKIRGIVRGILDEYSIN